MNERINSTASRNEKRQKKKNIIKLCVHFDFRNVDASEWNSTNEPRNSFYRKRNTKTRVSSPMQQTLVWKEHESHDDADSTHTHTKWGKQCIRKQFSSYNGVDTFRQTEELPDTHTAGQPNYTITFARITSYQLEFTFFLSLASRRMYVW